jgi:hypothetical protein
MRRLKHQQKTNTNNLYASYESPSTQMRQRHLDQRMDHMLKNSMFDKQRFNLLDIKRLWWLERHSHGQIAVNVAGIARSVVENAG